MMNGSMRCGACINIRSAPIRGNAQGTVVVGRVNVEQETRKVSERYDGTEKVQELKQKGGGLARVDTIGDPVTVYTRERQAVPRRRSCQGETFQVLCCRAVVRERSCSMRIGEVVSSTMSARPIAPSDARCTLLSRY